ncbi:MAG: FecR domain-containing protein [Betaproteobacteria bacterium]|nr:FecR domain-containing protein [Betaproteobacteria bacterium]
MGKRVFRSGLGLLLAWQALLFAPAAPAAETVGTVSFAIGQSKILRGPAHLDAAKGTALESGDVVETPEGGHVHIRFQDGAFVAVRPNSRLVIEQYHYDPAHPENSIVKFDLEQGTMRAISGKAAHEARDRFRLNTPLVAIGVRGTDFVTRVLSSSVTAAVNEGAIVVAPFDAGCMASGLGACSGVRARLLTAEMASVIEYGQHQLAPVLRPGIPKSLDTPALTVPEESSQAGPMPASQASTAVNGTAATNHVTTTYQAALPPDNSLVWGRWTFMQGGATPAPGDALSVPWNQAVSGRNPTVGNFYAGLFRTENGPVVFPSNLGTASFVLLDAGATFTGKNGVAQAATALGGTLSIDFANSVFNTALSLTSAPTGAVNLLASGKVTPNGYFYTASGSTALVSGAVAQDLRRAGYLFQLPVAAGTLSGITLWGR